MPWDMTYYSGVARHEMCSVSGTQLAPYFSLGACIQGLSDLFTDLFGIRLREVTDVGPGELWCDEVRKLSETIVAEVNILLEDKILFPEILCPFLPKYFSHTSVELM